MTILRVNTYKFDPPVPYREYFPNQFSHDAPVMDMSIHFVTVMDSSDHPKGDCCLQVNMGQRYDTYIDMPKYALYIHHEVKL